MPRRSSNTVSIEELTAEIDDRLSRFLDDKQGMSLREKVLRLVEIQTGFRRLNVAVARDEGLSARSGKERLRVYLTKHVGETIQGAELEVVSGISEYARRVREFRVEEGFRIYTGSTPDIYSGINLKPDEYLLVS